MEKTVQLWMARDNHAALEIHGNTVELETFSKYMDGIFPGEDDWSKFSEAVDRYGIYYLGERLADGTTVTVKDQYITYHFPDTIPVVTGFHIMNGFKRDIISNVTKITFLMRYDWLWNRGDIQASTLEIEGSYVSCE